MDPLFPVEPDPLHGAGAHAGEQPADGGPQRCRRCHRAITDTTSVAHQVGPRCRQILGITSQPRRAATRARRAPAPRPVPGQAELPLGVDADGSDDGDGQEGDGECGDQDSPFCSSFSFLT